MSPQKRRTHRVLSNDVPNLIVTAALHPLTPREGEVLGWIAAGKRNEEIGVILTCSPRTVQKHVQNILGKLEVETRTGACTWWHERRRSLERSLAANGK